MISILEDLLHKWAWFICLVVFKKKKKKKKSQLLLSEANGERVELGGKILKWSYDKVMSLYVSYILCSALTARSHS